MCILTYMPDQDLEVQCSECNVIFQVIWHRDLNFNAIEFCPFCGDAVEDFERAGEDSD